MTKKTVLGRDAFLNSAGKLKREPVELEEGIVYVRELSAKAALEYNDEVEKAKKDGLDNNASAQLRMVALLVSKTACDADGRLLFTKEDAEALMDNSINMLNVLALKAMEISGMSKDKIEEVSTKLKNAQKDSSATN